MVGGMAKATQDIAPYMIAEGSPANLRAINQVGLSRRGFSDEDIRALAPYVEEILADRCICVVGSEGKIAQHGDLFEHVETLN
jgi:UDP-N-acetylglucosamine acyltransferase